MEERTSETSFGIEENLKKAVTEMLILVQLEREDMYSSQIAKSLETGSGVGSGAGVGSGSSGVGVGPAAVGAGVGSQFLFRAGLPRPGQEGTRYSQLEIVPVSSSSIEVSNVPFSNQ